MKLTAILREDHNKHLIVGLAIVIGCAALACLAIKTFWSLPLGAYAGWHLARAVAWIKEGHDLRRPDTNTADIFDAELTVAGASIGLAASILVWALCFGLWGHP